MTRTITTGGGAVKRARAERAEIAVRAEGQGETPRDAQANAADRAATIRRKLPEDCEVQTENLRIIDESRAFDFDGESPYQAIETIEVSCSTETARSVATTVAKASGAVESLQFTVPGETRRQLENEALAAATMEARRKAEAIARVEDDTVTSLQSATTDVGGFMSDIVDDALESTPVAAYETPQVEIPAEVEATFALGSE